jgi:hypothetical protein
VNNANRVDTVIQSVRAEQRKHPRRSANLRVRVFWQEESADLIDAPGLVRDISANGFGIKLTRSLPKGKLLSVETTAGALQGVVRHVHPLADGCILGMEVLSASDGSDHQRSLRNLASDLEAAEGTP